MSTTRELSVTLVGPDIDHKASLEAMLGGRVRSLAWMPDSNSLLKGRSPTLGDRVRRAIDQLTHTRDPKFIDSMRRHLEQQQTDVVIAYWGSGPLADISAIKRLRPSVKVVLMVLCYPVALDHIGVRRQNFLMRRVARHLSGVMYSNSVMERYFTDEVFGSRGRHLRNVQIKPCWPASFQSEDVRSPVSDRPNLIFVGRTDLSHHTVHAADDLRPLMAEILEHQIELHHVRSPETTDGNPYRFPFDPVNQAELISMMSGYDATLIAYNTAACERAERFELTAPDRLITAVAAGVPVAVPAQGYSGSKEYLRDYPAVIEFDSVAHLREQLLDRPKIQRMRAAARQARSAYAAEQHGQELADYLAAL